MPARSPESRDIAVIAEIGKTNTLPLMNADRKKIIAKIAGEDACVPTNFIQQNTSHRYNRRRGCRPVHN